MTTFDDQIAALNVCHGSCGGYQHGADLYVGRRLSVREGSADLHHRSARAATRAGATAQVASCHLLAMWQRKTLMGYASQPVPAGGCGEAFLMRLGSLFYL